MMAKTNAEVIGKGLLDFESLEYYQQELIADYIGCCNSEDCIFDGKDTSVCTECKIGWLMKKWDEDDVYD